MRTSVRSLPAVLVLTLVAACGGGSGSPGGTTAACPIDTPDPLVGTKLATVDGHRVGSAAWEQLALRKSPADGSAWSDEEKRDLLSEAIDEEVLFREAFRRGLYQDPKVRKILVNLLLRDEVYEKVGAETFSVPEMEAFFARHREEFVVPEKIQLKRIFVAVGEQRSDDEAARLVADLRKKVVANPANWREVAMASSEDPFGRRGGDVGYVDREGKPGLPADVVTRAFELEQGAVSEPFFAGGGYNVLYVPARRERIERTFEQMKGAVMRRMKQERFDQLTASFLERLRTEAKISIDDASLAQWQAPVSDRPGLRLPSARAEAAQDDGPGHGGPPPSPNALPPAPDRTDAEEALELMEGDH